MTRSPRCFSIWAWPKVRRATRSRASTCGERPGPRATRFSRRMPCARSASPVGAQHDEQRALLPLYARAIDALRDGGDRELLLALETMRLSALILLAGEDSGFEHEADRFRDLPGDTPAECALLGLVARARMFAGAPAADVAMFARRAARHLTLERTGAPAVWFVGAAVGCPERI